MTMFEYCYNVKEVKSKERLCDALKETFKGKGFVVCCIGTDAVIGDSLGPMIGSRLKESLNGKTYVFGSVESPLIAGDMKTLSEMLSFCFPKTEILAIDAAFGDISEVGCVKLNNLPLKPGLGVKKDLPEIGTRSLVGIISERKADFLSCVRFSAVLPIVNTICGAIEKYFRDLEDLDKNYSVFPKNYEIPFKTDENLLKTVK